MVSVVQNPLQGEVLAPLLEPVLEAHLSRFPGSDTLLIERACALAMQAHKGQLRRTGNILLKCLKLLTNTLAVT